MELPKPITSKPHNEMMKLLSERYVEQAEITMRTSALKLCNIVLTGDPEQVEIHNNKMIYNVAATVDGTWQRRGQLLTGEKLDCTI